MKKGFKLLICFIFSLFIGLNVVKADAPSSITLPAGPIDDNHPNGWNVYNINPNWPFYGKLYNLDGRDRYLFCLDAHKNFAFGETLNRASTDQTDLEKRIGNLYARAYRFGLGEGSTHTIYLANGSKTTISDVDLYAVTQMAVWDVMHPNSDDIDGYSNVSQFVSWIGDTSHPERAYIFGLLKAAAESVSSEPINYDGNYEDFGFASNSTKLTQEGEYLVSSEFEFSANPVYSDDFEFTVTAVSSKTGVQKVGGQWTSSVTVKKGDKIRIRVEKPTDYQGSVRAEVSYGRVGSFLAGWTAYFYQAPSGTHSNGFGYQNIALPIPTMRSVNSKSIVLTGDYTNTMPLDVSKKSINGQSELPGAKMKIYEKENTSEVLANWTSGTTPYKVLGIVADRVYVLEENVAPTGYVRLTTRIEFKMDASGQITLLSNTSAANTTAYHLTVFNELYTRDVSFSKMSTTTGQEVPGAELKICTEAAFDAAVEYTGDGNKCIPDSEDWMWVSDNTEHLVHGLPSGVYYFVETLPPSGYVQQTNNVRFEVSESGPSDPVVFENTPTRLVISKKDATTEAELPGAHLKICTLEAYQKDGKDCEAFNELDWISEETPKYIEALPFGKYVLIETIPPTNYVEGMIVEGKELSAYEFEVSAENHDIKIDVYNRILVEVPKTGISLINLFAIGGLMIFIGYETIKIYRKKANS